MKHKANAQREARLKDPRDPIHREEDVIPTKDLPDGYRDYLPGGKDFDPQFPVIAPVYSGEGYRPKKAWFIKQDDRGNIYLESDPEALEMARERYRKRSSNIK